jgi:hypothetical protein
VLIPISSKLKFALIPNEDRDNSIVLGKRWEKVFADVADVTQLPILPKVNMRDIHNVHDLYSLHTCVGNHLRLPSLQLHASQTHALMPSCVHHKLPK